MDNQQTITLPNSDKVELSLAKAKVRQRVKTNGKGEPRKMKLHFDLNKEEAASFKSVIEVIRPPEVDMNTFVKQMFLIGVNGYIAKIQEMAQENMDPEAMENVEVITPESNIEPIS